MVSGASGASDRGGMSLDVSLQGGSNKTIRGCVQLRRRELSVMELEVVLAASGASHQDVWGVYGCIFSCPMAPSASMSQAAALLARTHVIT